MNLLDTLVEVKFKEQDDFLKIKETLTRIGFASKKDRTLYQSCHILHKRDKYYIIHFKELFLLDGKNAEMTHNDVARRNSIAQLLEKWDLLTIVNPDVVQEPTASMGQIKVVPFKEKEDWNLVSKYTVGRK